MMKCEECATDILKPRGRQVYCCLDCRRKGESRRIPQRIAENAAELKEMMEVLQIRNTFQKPGKSGTVRCFMCAELFESPDKIHIRYCEPCKTRKMIIEQENALDFVEVMALEGSEMETNGTTNQAI